MSMVYRKMLLEVLDELQAQDMLEDFSDCIDENIYAIWQEENPRSKSELMSVMLENFSATEITMIMEGL
jgi:hypothetical protein